MPIHAFSHAGLPRFGDQPGLVELVDEIVEIVAGLEDDVPTLAAIAAAGTAFGTVGLTMEGDASLSSMTSPGEDLDFINKHGSGVDWWKDPRRSRAVWWSGSKKGEAAPRPFLCYRGINSLMGRHPE